MAILKTRLRFDRVLRETLLMHPGTAMAKLAESVPAEKIQIGPPVSGEGAAWAAQEFEARRYVIASGLIPPDAAEDLSRYALAVAATATSDTQVAGTPATYGDAVMEDLLELLLPKMEALSGCRLDPTYAYFRVYKRGDTLKRHQDREACEISCSVALSYSMEEPWPLWIEGPAGTTATRLAPGSGLIYRGIECPHWRDALEGDHTAQVFLHYVDRNGPHAPWRLDGRPALGLPATARRPVDRSGR
jgi:hypothetical protein